MTEIETLQKKVAHNYKIAIEAKIQIEHFEKENVKLREILISINKILESGISALGIVK